MLRVFFKWQVKYFVESDELTRTQASCTLPGQPMYASMNKSTIINDYLHEQSSSLSDCSNQRHSLVDKQLICVCPINSTDCLWKSPACFKVSYDISQLVTGRKIHTKGRDVLLLCFWFQ